MSVTKRQVQALILGWLAMLGWDFLLHGGFLAQHYLGESQFLLPPKHAFQLIPLGYLSFLLNAILILWISKRFEITSWKKALTFGLTLGFLSWCAFVLGLISISTIEIPLALGWIIGQTLEIGIGALVIYLALQAQSLRKLSIYIILFISLAFVLTIILQNIGVAPAVVLSQ